MGEQLILGEEANRIPCGHLFHENCIKEWLRTSNQCPVCRYELPTDDVRYEEERQSHASSRRPRLRRADLNAKSVRELRHLARHLDVSVAGCIEKEDIVQRLAASGTVELICDDIAQGGSLMAVNVPDSCKLSSAELANMSVKGIRDHMIQMGVDTAGCYQKRELIQRLIAAGRVAASSQRASELVLPSERIAESQLQGLGESAADVVFSEEGNEAIAVYRDGAASEAASDYAAAKAYGFNEGDAARL